MGCLQSLARSIAPGTFGRNFPPNYDPYEVTKRYPSEPGTQLSEKSPIDKTEKENYKTDNVTKHEIENKTSFPPKQRLKVKNKMKFAAKPEEESTSGKNADSNLNRGTYEHGKDAFKGTGARPKEFRVIKQESKSKEATKKVKSTTKSAIECGKNAILAEAIKDMEKDEKVNAITEEYRRFVKNVDVSDQDSEIMTEASTEASSIEICESDHKSATLQKRFCKQGSIEEKVSSQSSESSKEKSGSSQYFSITSSFEVSQKSSSTKSGNVDKVTSFMTDQAESEGSGAQEKTSNRTISRASCGVATKEWDENVPTADLSREITYRKIIKVKTPDTDSSSPLDGKEAVHVTHGKQAIHAIQGTCSKHFQRMARSLSKVQEWVVDPLMENSSNSPDTGIQTDVGMGTTTSNFFSAASTGNEGAEISPESPIPYDVVNAEEIAAELAAEVAAKLAEEHAQDLAKENLERPDTLEIRHPLTKMTVSSIDETNQSRESSGKNVSNSPKDESEEIVNQLNYNEKDSSEKKKKLLTAKKRNSIKRSRLSSASRSSSGDSEKSGELNRQPKARRLRNKSGSLQPSDGCIAEAKSVSKNDSETGSTSERNANILPSYSDSEILNIERVETEQTLIIRPSGVRSETDTKEHERKLDVFAVELTGNSESTTSSEIENTRL